jgi:hypothetical protein
LVQLKLELADADVAVVCDGLPRTKGKERPPTRAGSAMLAKFNVEQDRERSSEFYYY